MSYLLLSIMLLLSNSVIYAGDAGDAEITQLLLSSKNNPTYDVDPLVLVSSSSLDHKNITDERLQKIWQQNHFRPQVFSVQHNLLQNPQPSEFRPSFSRPLFNYMGELNLSHGTIEILRIGDWLTAMPRLRILKATHNKIASIASSNDVETVQHYGPCGYLALPTAWHNYFLQELDLSHNELTELDLHILNNATRLAKADFSHNKIERVIVPSNLQHRESCTVTLHGNQLGDAEKKLLEKDNSLCTAAYQTCMKGAMVSCGACGLLTGFIVIVGVSVSMTPVWGVVGVGSVGVIPAILFGGGALGAVPAYLIARCCYPKDKRTYKPFVFQFEAEENDVLVALEQE